MMGQRPVTNESMGRGYFMASMFGLKFECHSIEHLFGQFKMGFSEAWS